MFQDDNDHNYQTKKTKSGRNIPNYRGFFDKTSRPDMSEEENVIQNNEVSNYLMVHSKQMRF